MNHIDLHVHSKYSIDGELSVQKLTDRCLTNGVSMLSITDHNSVGAIGEAITLCQEKSIDFIPGIEIDCCYNGTDLHLLGYHIDWQSDEFVRLEQSIRQKVMDAFPEMIDRLAKAGIRVDREEVLEKANGQLPCGELIAEVLLANPFYHTNKKLLPYLPGGVRSDMPYLNFYLDYFAQGKPAFVKVSYMDFREAVELVRQSGGIPVVAHPGLNFRGREAIVSELVQNGAEGLEAFNNYHDTEQSEFFARFVVQQSLVMTCGSDFHGKNKPLIDLGQFRTIDKYKEYLLKSVGLLQQCKQNYHD